MDVIKNIISELSPFLKQIGFVKKGSDFYKVSDKNYGVINFQKSRDSNNNTVKFTINFGIYSNVLGQELDDHNELTKPKVDQCQWQARVGDFMPNNPDFWWDVNTSENLNNTNLEVMKTIQNIVVPEIHRHLTDEDLINCWKNENYAGTTEIGRFKYLTVLLKKKGDFDILNQVIETFMQKSKGRPNGSIAMEHLKDIGYIR